MDVLPQRQRRPLLELGTVILVAVGCVASIVAWAGPKPKSNAIFGRLDYLQFVIAVVLTAASVGAVVAMSVPRRKRRFFGFRLVAVMLAVFIALLGVELLLFVLPKVPTHNPYLFETKDGFRAGSEVLMYEREPHLKWSGQSVGWLATETGRTDPYARIVEFATDFEGFRNGRDLTSADVVFIGDSHTEAGYIWEQETYVQRVADKLKLVARNLGRINFSPSEELVVLKTYGLKCQPQAVVWQICEHNDLFDEWRYRAWLDQGAPNVLPSRRTRREMWQSRSPTCRFFASLCRREPWPCEGLFRDAKGNTHPMLFGTFLSEHQSPVGHPGWPLMANSLREGADLLRREKVGLVVVLIPMKLRALGRCVEFNDSTKRTLAGDWDLPDDATLAKHLAELCDELAVSFVDTTPRLKELAAAGEMVFPPFDTHLSPYGHSVVADLIAPVLEQVISAGHLVD